VSKYAKSGGTSDESATGKGRTTLNGEELDHQTSNELKAGSESETFTG
jgi:hypothetical protein